MLGILPALVYSLLMVALIAAAILVKPIAVVMQPLWMDLLYAVPVVPIAALIYLYILARRYVRVVHGGFNSPLPFVLIYGAANLVLWGCGTTVLAFIIFGEGR